MANRGLLYVEIPEPKNVIILLVTLTGWGVDPMYVSKSERVSGNIVLESYCKPTMMVEGFVNKNEQ